MDFKQYYEARQTVVEIMRKDLLGPVDENEIICDERPLDYYITGKLYPLETSMQETAQASSEDCGELDEETNVSLSNSRNPSSFGLSFSLNSPTTEFTVAPKAAKYVLINRNEAQKVLGFYDDKYKAKAHFWKRNELEINPIKISIADLVVGKSKKILVYDNLFINVLYIKFIWTALRQFPSQ